MDRSLSGKPRYKYRCEVCRLEFITCGNPQRCPRCYSELPIDKERA